jgi:hypothetical protein
MQHQKFIKRGTTKKKAFFSALSFVPPWTMERTLVHSWHVCCVLVTLGNDNYYDNDESSGCLVPTSHKLPSQNAKQSDGISDEMNKTVWKSDGNVPTCQGPYWLRVETEKISNVTVYCFKF